MSVTANGYSNGAEAAPPKVLVANRGEIALRIMRTAKKLGIPSIAIYTLADAETPHVRMADEAHQIGDGTDPRGYLDIEAIVEIAKKSGATLVAPGYGFLSENASFVKAIEAEGITFLGPTPHQMTSMGLKHEARAVALKAGVPVVPGSDGAVDDLEVAVVVAEKIGYPIIVKASGGGGGMGMEVCRDEAELRNNFEATRIKGQTLFKEPTVFLEKYIARARHVEVQIFGNGAGHVVHFGERECSVQRRHQKVIEEAPCALFASEIGKQTRERMCAAAVALGELMQYRSAGTVEFILDDTSPTLDFYFLELNARIQVEHPITEVIRPGLDLVELMIKQGLRPDRSLPKEELQQDKCAAFEGHAIEVRVYCENPKQDFRPCPGRLQVVEWGDIGERGRIETWVSTGTLVTPHYDPMIAKLIVYGETRHAAIEKMLHMLNGTTMSGPPNNIDYLKTILDGAAFRDNKVYTTSLDSFEYTPSAIEVVSPGVATSVQDLPGRPIGKGICRGGAADQHAMRIANWLVGNDWKVEGLEMTMIGAKILFHVDATVAVAGAEMAVTINKKPVEMWKTLHIKAGDVINVGTAKGAGMRSYLAIKGGFPSILPWMGSKSTFTGASLGGYQGRNLLAGDMLEISRSGATDIDRHVPEALRPKLGNEWQIEVTPSTQWSSIYVSPEGMKTILEAEFTATAASNRAGLRIDGPRIKWARENGGEGGSHPSNVLDQGYAFGSLNLNGDTPVLFGVDAPDLGGFANLVAASISSVWKFGQIRPGDKIRFVVVDVAASLKLKASTDAWLDAVKAGSESSYVPGSLSALTPNPPSDSKVAEQDDLLIRAISDEYINIEFGPMVLDMKTRVKAQLWEREMVQRNVKGVKYIDTSIRSSIMHYDPAVISQDELVKIALEAVSELGDVASVKLPINVFRMPIVPDDRWTHESIEYYRKTARKEAVYLPNNFKYVARNNGLEEEQMRDVLLGTPWTVVAIGFFVMLPLLIPTDPRKRVLAQKYNPSRTKTCEGAVGLAGVIGSIYPIESPGGYQLLGRTLSTWRPWNKENSLVGNFDQVEFYEVPEDEFEQINRQYKAGMWLPEVRQVEFNVAEHLKFEDSIKEETKAFKEQQTRISAQVAVEEEQLFQAYLAEKAAEEKALADKVSKGQAPAGVGRAIVAPLSANVWKFYAKPGDVIKDDDQRIVELEAMKTSVWVTPGDDTVGKKILSFAVKEGDAVTPGQTLLYIEE